MLLRNSPARWGGVAQLFHWSTALIVFGLMGLGWVMVYWPLGPTQFALYAWHKSFGITVLALVILRLLWRAVTADPARPPGMPRWEARLAALTHALLYALLALMCVSGYVLNSATNFPLSVFGWLSLPNVTGGENEGLAYLAGRVHLLAFWALAATAALHVAAALRHHFLLGDPVLRRMLPGGRR